MQNVSLADALGGMRLIPQFFIWRLTWNPSRNKFDKVPCNAVTDTYPMDASLPHNWHTFDEACTLVDVFRAADPHHQYTLGFYLTAQCGYWFLDIDHCITGGQYNAIAIDLVGQLPGCMFEISSSQTGVHVIGRGEIPPHGTQNKSVGVELYTHARGIAFGLDDRAWGSADLPGPAVLDIAAKYFPYSDSGADGAWDKPRADWSGPTDDGELLRRALASQSVMARFGERASFSDLWNGRQDVLQQFYGVDGQSEMDAALASHLAFWTGCDGPRIERLMRMSNLYRAKWDEHRRYLRDLTIDRMCAKQRDVCTDRATPEAVAAVNTEMYGMSSVPLAGTTPIAPAVGTVTLTVSPEAKQLIDSLLDVVHSSPDWADVHNRVIPMIRDAGIPPAFMPRLENAINKRLELWDAKLKIGNLRALLKPPRITEDETDESGGVVRPEWVERYVYVTEGDFFHDTVTGLGLSRTSFNATHDRDMPIKGDGPMREDSVMWALHRWQTPVVHDTIYYPGAPAVVEHNGKQWANLYSESSLPVTAVDYTADGVAGIGAFLKHLQCLCGQRESVYMNLLSFMAHNVKYPGKKIRWAPIIKGVQGDGKTLIGQVLRAAMGWRNVASIGPEIVANSGGFTDWAHGNAFVMLEELYMAGKERYRISNGIKQFVTNDDATINPKGGKPKKVINTCNQAAATNHNDAVPLDDEDRRWFVIFTPFAKLPQLCEAMGLSGVVELEKHFDVIYHSLKTCAGEWRRWLLDFQIPEWFSANRGAMATDEKQIMRASGMDDLESVVREIIETGSYGVSSDILSSACLTTELKRRSFSDGIEIPKGHSVHHLLNRVGFMKVEKSLKWQSSAHRVWIKPGIPVTPDVLRALLDITHKKPGVTQ